MITWHCHVTQLTFSFILVTGTPGSGSAKWSYHEERFFFEYLRLIKGTQTREDCANGIATVLKSKDAQQIGSYYDGIITAMRRHLKSAVDFKKQSSLESIHYTMVVYWEKILVSIKFECNVLPFNF